MFIFTNPAAYNLEKFRAQLECMRMWTDGLISREDYINQKNLINGDLYALEYNPLLVEQAS